MTLRIMSETSFSWPAVFPTISNAGNPAISQRFSEITVPPWRVKPLRTPAMNSSFMPTSAPTFSTTMTTIVSPLSAFWNAALIIGAGVSICFQPAGYSTEQFHSADFHSAAPAARAHAVSTAIRMRFMAAGYQAFAPSQRMIRDLALLLLLLLVLFLGCSWEGSIEKE